MGIDDRARVDAGPLRRRMLTLPELGQARIVEVGLVGRAAAVEAIEVEPRGAEVFQRIRVVQSLQRRGAMALPSPVQMVDEVARLRIENRELEQRWAGIIPSLWGSLSITWAGARGLHKPK